MRQVPFNPGPIGDTTAQVKWLLDKVENLCTATNVNTPEDIASDLESGYQPLDSDLTAIAALMTTSFGRDLLTLADEAAAQSALALVIGTNVQAHGSMLDKLSSLADPNADRIVYWRDSGNLFDYLSTANGVEISGTNLQMTAAQRTSAIVWSFDGGGATITVGYHGEIYVPFACTITAVTLVADQSGSIEIDILKKAIGSFPPAVPDTIVASDPPAIVSSDHAQNTTLTGWTKTIAAGDALRFYARSATSITRCSLILTVTKT